MYAYLKLVSWLYTQTTLTSLHIASSSFKNTSPEMFWSFVFHFSFLSLFNNSIGSLPRLTSNVVIFDINGNNMSGSLSHLLCHNMIEKSNLKYFVVYENHLSG
ncbi:hypothetical protein MTR_8g041130 [Medicago truncatula]|uniref:Non-specific serine/threonine protein kinase n=1 Tax=Medicago truncatula TaxID=3880 RepID=G7LIB0_MEDTR|nr:hypothetical protein MTR_8g041130 [Medicago truncatula]